MGFVDLFSVSIRLFVFFFGRPGIALSANGCPRPKVPKNPVLFPARRGPFGQNAKGKKIAHFLGENFGADGFFS